VIQGLRGRDVPLLYPAEPRHRNLQESKEEKYLHFLCPLGTSCSMFLSPVLFFLAYPVSFFGIWPSPVYLLIRSPSFKLLRIINFLFPPPFI
jgi:hypothetical protein